MATNPVIRIQGARQHNLKNLNLEIPRNQLVVITGVSGSGKSSLAFDTLYAEGQRRYVESLSAYARQFLDQLEKPEVDFIEGLTPAIAIEQRSSQPNPRSTIATATEIYDYLRILFAAIGRPHDPETGTALVRHTTGDIVGMLTSQPEKTRVIILAPVKTEAGEEVSQMLDRLKKQGFLRVRIDGEMTEIDELEKQPKKKSEIEVVVDRIVIREDIRSRLADSLETAQRLCPTVIRTLVQEPGQEDYELHDFTTVYTNPETGYTLGALTTKHFSFNSHLGACPDCHGLGSTLRPDPELIMPFPEKTLDQGGVKTWWSGSKKRKGFHQRAIADLAEEYKQGLNIPVGELSSDFTEALLYGNDNFEGLCTQALRLLDQTKSEVTRRNVRRFMSPYPCKTCEGSRLKDEILAVTMDHETDPRSIEGFTSLSIGEALQWLDGVILTGQQKSYAVDVLNEVRKRLSFLTEVGLGYLTLDRHSGTLSGGESQRIRLATQLGAGLAGVLYVLDEPSIGLHQSDNEKLIATLKNLRDAGNTVIIVEHDEETMREADHLIDIGPGAGEEGGRLLSQGTPAEVIGDENSITGAWLSGDRKIEIPTPRTIKKGSPAIVIKGARENNLKSVDVSFPLGNLICVTGLSGSGKSTLVDTILRRALFRHFHQSKDRPGVHDSISGFEHVDKAIVIDQAPIGRSPRSNPATYTNVFNPIRDLFSQLPSSRARGYGPGRFSFNVTGGRCEACQGDGSIKIDMHFLSDVYVTCEACNGKRYNRETLDITYRGKSIADVLEMTAAEALTFFAKIPAISQRLRALRDVGLGYLHLGQSATTLSGGEAQRIKLASELGKTSTGQTVYLLDEPTTGLHFGDIATLLEVFYRLRDAGNTLIVIEHNLDVIKCADRVIDLGPGGGSTGGEIVAVGTPAEVAANAKSVTGRYLKF
ncbi:MAG: excinuclease ABC subunit UvrA [Verrucomicrobiales bacterium]|nr:excinuclease ABC subunit UvrA [Verrucomicrobiales bacterium]